jgi:ArsR family transcriptional regulator, arsenate/arsenite/antimonite-responsive transcriptional repressor
MKTTADLFKSLADETRLKILWLLLNRQELCVCDIMKTLDITQSKASRHLRYLYHLGWVSDRREGLWIHYRLSVPPGSYAASLLAVLGQEMSNRLEAQDLLSRLETWLNAKGRQDLQEKNACNCKLALEPS